MSRLILVFLSVNALLVAGECLAEQPASDDDSLTPQQIEEVIQALGDSKSQVRKQAYETLASQNRGIVPLLEPFANVEDPELRVSVRQLINELTSSPNKAPQRYTLFTTKAYPKELYCEWHEDWKIATADWLRGGTVCASNLTGNIGCGFNAQSFVPHCDRITSVLLCVHPTGGVAGWVRLDLCEDKANRPDPNPLARSWVRWEADCPVPFYGFTVFEFPETKVRKDATYWLCFKAFPDANANPGSGFYFAGGSHGDSYPEGGHLDWGNRWINPDLDIKFAILSRAAQFPGQRRATKDDLRRLPPTPLDK